MKRGLVETTAWNGEWGDGAIIATGDFGHEDSRCWKVRCLQKDDRAPVSSELGAEESSCTTGLTLKGKVIGSFRYLALERTRTSARPGNCRDDSGGTGTL